ncbi:MAG: hypothetical protein ACFE9C_14550 [Candidatus Hodarchaeota archaeon]
MESDRESILKKFYMKFFLVAIIMLGTGISLVCVRTLFMIYADPGSPEEVEFYMNFTYTLSALMMLLIQLGLALFCFSSFWGAMSDRTLPDNIRRGMVITTSISIISLALFMIFGGFLIY